MENVEYIVVFWNGDIFDLDLSLERFVFYDFSDDFLWSPFPTLLKFPVEILPVKRWRLWKLIKVELFEPFIFGNLVFYDT